MQIENVEAFKKWLFQVLSKIFDADSEKLALYIVALVKKLDNSQASRERCVNDLEVFLESNTKQFVDTLFDALTSKSYLPLDLDPNKNKLEPVSSQNLENRNRRFNNNNVINSQQSTTQVQFNKSRLSETNQDQSLASEEEQDKRRGRRRRKKKTHATVVEKRHKVRSRIHRGNDEDESSEDEDEDEDEEDEEYSSGSEEEEEEEEEEVLNRSRSPLDRLTLPSTSNIPTASSSSTSYNNNNNLRTNSEQQKKQFDNENKQQEMPQQHYFNNNNNNRFGNNNNNFNQQQHHYQQQNYQNYQQHQQQHFNKRRMQQQQMHQQQQPFLNQQFQNQRIMNLPQTQQQQQQTMPNNNNNNGGSCQFTGVQNPPLNNNNNNNEANPQFIMLNPQQQQLQQQLHQQRNLQQQQQLLNVNNSPQNIMNNINRPRHLVNIVTSSGGQVHQEDTLIFHDQQNQQQRGIKRTYNMRTSMPDQATLNMMQHQQSNQLPNLMGVNTAQVPLIPNSNPTLLPINNPNMNPLFVQQQQQQQQIPPSPSSQPLFNQQQNQFKQQQQPPLLPNPNPLTPMIVPNALFTHHQHNIHQQPLGINNNNNNIISQQQQQSSIPSSANPNPSSQNPNQNTTLVVCKIPLELNRMDKMQQHFSQFGQLVQIKCHYDNSQDTALIQFATNQQAYAAFKCPTPVFNNRFIRLYWLNNYQKMSKSNVSSTATVSGQNVMATTTTVAPSVVSDESANKKPLKERLTFHTQPQKQNEQKENQQKLITRTISNDLAKPGKKKFGKKKKIKKKKLNIQANVNNNNKKKILSIDCDEVDYIEEMNEEIDFDEDDLEEVTDEEDEDDEIEEEEEEEDEVEKSSSIIDNNKKKQQHQLSSLSNFNSLTLSNAAISALIKDATSLSAAKAIQEENQKKTLLLQMEVKQKARELMDKQIKDQKLLLQKFEEAKTVEEKSQILKLVKTLSESIEKERELLKTATTLSLTSGNSSGSESESMFSSSTPFSLQKTISPKITPAPPHSLKLNNVRVNNTNFLKQANAIAPAASKYAQQAAAAHSYYSPYASHYAQVANPFHHRHHLSHYNKTISNSAYSKYNTATQQATAISVDRRPKQLLITGIENSEEKQTILHFIASIGCQLENVNNSPDEKENSLLLNFITRKDAEIALAKCSTSLSNNNLSISWFKQPETPTTLVKQQSETKLEEEKTSTPTVVVETPISKEEVTIIDPEPKTIEKVEEQNVMEEESKEMPITATIITSAVIIDENSDVFDSLFDDEPSART